MSHNANFSQNFSKNGSYIQNFIENIDTEENPIQSNKLENIKKHGEDQQSPNEGGSRAQQSSRNNFIKQATKSNNNQSQKSAFELQLQQLERKLFHQVILKSELGNQTQFDRQVLKRLSESIKADLEDTLSDIQKTEQRLENPLLNYLQKQEIKQTLLQLRMQQLAHTKVLVNTYRHHQYRLVLSLFHIAQIYLQLKCHQQALNHLENALSVNDASRHVSKDVEYFHSILLSFLALSQFQVQSLNLSIDNLNKALEIHQSLKADRYDFHDFFSLNLISKVLLCAGKGSQAISFAKMAIQSAQNDYSSESIQYATACKTLSQALASQHSFQPSLQELQTALRTLQVHHPSKQQTIIEFYEKLTQITFKKLMTLKPEHPGQHYFDEYLQVMREKYNVVENTYGYRDKRVIKEKRHLASSLLKYGKVTEAEEELQDILEIQQVVYGEKSIEVAKTLKLLGTVAMSLNQTAKAQKHLKKSMGIFHDQGQVNLEKQVQAKLLILTGKGKFLIKNNNNNNSNGKM